MVPKRRVTSLLPVLLKWQIKRFSNIHIQGQQPNIFMFSTARSGSTWIKEVLATQPYIKFIDEPFNMNHFAATYWPLPPSWEFLVPHPGREVAIERYIEDLTHNRIGVGSPAPFDRFHRILSRRLVFKILRCKDLMNWFEEKFGAKIVYLIRHPLATSVSRDQYELAALYLANDLYCDRYMTSEQRQIGRAILENGSELEKKVLDWCCQNLPPLKFLDRSEWLCLHYEDLVAEPDTVLRHMAQELELPRLDKMLRRVGVASATITKSDSETKRYFAQSFSGEDHTYLLRKWRDKVPSEEEKRAFEILYRFGIETYAFGEDMPAKRLTRSAMGRQGPS